MDRVRSIGTEAPAGRRVLVLGREAAASEATEQYLEYCGHEVSLAKDPETAMSEAEKLQPEVLVCDLNLGSGAERLRAVRKIRERHGSVIVIISTHHRLEILREFPELGPADVLRKPVWLHQLARKVSDAVTH